MKFNAEMFADLARSCHDPDAAEKAAGLLNGTVDPDTVLDSVLVLDHEELVMEALDKVLECHGVEALRVDGCLAPIGTYLNTGDPYVTTVVLDEDGEFHVTCYGDFVEAWEQEQGPEYTLWDAFMDGVV